MFKAKNNADNLSRWLVTTGFLLLSSASLASEVRQSGVLDEIIVTAQQRAESIQDIPISASALLGENLQKQNVTRMEDLTGTVPNLSINKASFANVVNIRGIASGINQGFDQSVGMFQDGIYMGRGHQMRIPFLDLQRVEVLRGAQSVLFGKNTIAGAISMHSMRPGPEIDGRIDGSYIETYNKYSIEAAASLPLSDSFNMRLAYLKAGADGYMRNIVDRTDTPEADEWSGRLSFSWDVTANLQAFFKYQVDYFDTKGSNWEVVSAPTQEAREVYGEDRKDRRHSVSNNSGVLAGTRFAFEVSDNRHRNAMLQLDYTTPFGVLTSLTGYSWYDYFEIHDAGWSPQAWIAGDEREDFSLYSQEIRFASEQGGRFDYILGAYYQKSQLKFDEIISVPFFAEVEFVDALTGVDLGLPPGTAVFANESAQVTEYIRDEQTAAVFGQLSWHFADSWTFTVGGRYVYTDIEAFQDLFIADVFGEAQYQPEGVDIGNGLGLGPRGVDATLLVWSEINVEPHTFKGKRRKAHNFTGAVNLQYDWNDDIMTYLRFDRGIKDGGFDPRSVTANPKDFEFDEEKADTIELGMKSRLLGGAAELNVALFYSIFNDRQVSVFNGGLAFEVTNAGESEAVGVEVDGRWALTPYLMISGGAAYIDIEWTKYERSACAPAFRGGPRDNGDETCDLSGMTTFATPDISGYLAIDHFFNLTDRLEVASRLAFRHRGVVQTNPGNDPVVAQPAHTKIDARLAIRNVDDTWELALVGTNLTDEYVMFAGTVIPLSEDIVGPQGAHVASIEPPRSFGLQFRYRF